MMFKPALFTFLFAGIAAGCGEIASTTDPSLSAAAAVSTGHSVHVGNTAELLSAVSSAGSGVNIVLAPGEYELASTLGVPDGITLIGSGVMAFDAGSRLPSGFDPATRTVLKAAITLTGDVVKLGNRANLKGLVIQDPAGRTGGSAVVVHSRRAGDHVSVRLEDCEIINPNPPSSSSQSAGGRALVVLTRNRAHCSAHWRPSKWTDYRSHDWRHTYAVQALRDGEAPQVVAHQLGHKTAAMVHAVYGRYVPIASDYRSGQTVGLTVASASAPNIGKTRATG